MPGTHSKHLAIAERAIRDFRTFMTGELFDVVSAHTILRYSVAPLGETVALLNPDHLTAFRAGVEHARRLPLAAALFRVRTRQLLDQAAPETNRAFLSGTLIGAELAHLAGQRQADETIVLAAGRALAPLYRQGIESLGLDSRALFVAPADVDRLSALGQARLLRRLGE